MTPFAKRVYKIVLSIPLGRVRSYKWVAQKAGSPAAFQAVGQVLKRNPYPLIIPCHRVIRNDKEAGGYALGAKQKKLLLKLERELAKCLLSKK